MIDISISLKIEKIDNGLLVIGTREGEEVRKYYCNIKELLESVALDLHNQVRDADMYDWSRKFSLSLEVHALGKPESMDFDVS